MLNLTDFVMKTLYGMKTKYPEFQVREYALNWYSKGVLFENNLIEIESWYEPGKEPVEDLNTKNEEETE